MHRILRVRRLSTSLEENHRRIAPHIPQNHPRILRDDPLVRVLPPIYHISQIIHDMPRLIHGCDIFVRMTSRGCRFLECNHACAVAVIQHLILLRYSLEHSRLPHICNCWIFAHPCFLHILHSGVEEGLGADLEAFDFAGEA